MDRPWGRPYTRKLAAFLAQLACGMVTLQRALTGVLGTETAKTIYDLVRIGTDLLIHLIHWVGPLQVTRRRIRIGEWPRHGLRDGGWLGLGEVTYIVIVPWRTLSAVQYYRHLAATNRSAT